MSSSIITNETVRKLAALAAGIGIGPLSLRVFTVLGFHAAGSAHDGVEPLAFWLTSSSIAQLCAAALVVGGGAIWLAAYLARSGRERGGAILCGRDQQELKASA